MPSILVATGFVRIDADTKPAMKALKAFGAIGGNLLATAMGPASAAVVTAVGSVASAAAAAGAGLAVYGAAVKQQFTQVQSAMQKQTTAEDARTKATNASAIAQQIAKENGFKYGQAVKITSDMTEQAKTRAQEYNSALASAKSSTKAATQAQALYKTELGGMPKPTQKLTESLQKLKDDTKAWSDSLAGSTMPVFTKGVEFLDRLLPKLSPIVRLVAHDIDVFVDSLGQGQAGAVFTQFGHNVQKFTGGALAGFLGTLKNVVVGVVGLLNAFMPMSVGVTGGLEKMTAKFANWGATLGKSGGFKSFTDLAGQTGPKLINLFKVLADAFIKVASAAGPMSGVGLTLLTIFTQLIDAIPTPVLRLLVPAILAVNTGMKLYAIYQSAAAAATWLFSTAVTTSSGQIATSRAALLLFRIQQVASAVATGVATAAQWAWNAAMSANPIGLVIIGIAALVAAIVWVALKTTWFQTAWKATWDFLKMVGRWFAGPFTDFFKAAWNLIYKYFVQPQVQVFTQDIPNAAKALWSKVTGWWNALSAGLKAAWDLIYKWAIRPLITYFTVSIPTGAKNLRDRVVGWWNNLQTGLSNAYNLIKTRVFNPMQTFFTKTIPGWASTMSSRVKGFFSSMRDGIGTIWNGVKDKAKAPINWVLDHVWNRGIVSVWGKIAGWIGIKNTLGKIKLLAAGGTVGNQPFGVFNRPTAIVGEGNPQYPEYVIPTDPKYKGRGKALWQAAGAHFMANGGILGSIGGWLSSAASSVANTSKSAIDFLTDPAGKAKSMLNGTIKGMSAAGTSPWAKAATSLPQKAVDGLLNAVKKVGSSLLGALGLGTTAGSGVKRWTPQVLTVLKMVGQVPGLLGITLKRMNQESGGNPNIVNRTDSNWKAGHPSVGLMQVIAGTFRAYAGKFRNVGPFLYGVSVNPIANIYASMKYALSRYGSLVSAYGRAGGYRNGTNGTAGGFHLFGENGPEAGFSPAGWRILNAQKTAGLGGAGLNIERLVLENHGVIGSQHEVENWLVESLTDLKRKNRLP